MLGVERGELLAVLDEADDFLVGDFPQGVGEFGQFCVVAFEVFRPPSAFEVAGLAGTDRRCCRAMWSSTSPIVPDSRTVVSCLMSAAIRCLSV